MEDYVWVFTRPDLFKTSQIPSPEPREEKLWWNLMVVLLQIYGSIA